MNVEKLQFRCSVSIWGHIKMTQAQLEQFLISIYEAGGEENDPLTLCVKKLLVKIEGVK